MQNDGQENPQILQNSEQERRRNEFVKSQLDNVRYYIANSEPVTIKERVGAEFYHLYEKLVMDRVRLRFEYKKNLDDLVHMEREEEDAVERGMSGNLVMETRKRAAVIALDWEITLSLEESRNHHQA